MKVKRFAKCFCLWNIYWSCIWMYTARSAALLASRETFFWSSHASCQAKQCPTCNVPFHAHLSLTQHCWNVPGRAGKEIKLSNCIRNKPHLFFLSIIFSNTGHFCRQLLNSMLCNVRIGGCLGSWWGNRRERDHWGVLGVDGWIILGWISRSWYVGIRTGLGWPRWRTLLSVVMNLRVPWNVGNFLTSCKPVSFLRRTLHHGVSN